MIGAHAQASYDVRLEWGPTGAAAVASDLGPTDVAVVVDVLSFTTTLTVAVERGIEVIPVPWRGPEAQAAAEAHDAVLAVGRLEGRERPGLPSLSPAAMAQVRDVRRVVLPSPNGATTCHRLASERVQVVGACLRNAGAVAGWLAPRIAAGSRVVVVPAGERWPDDTLRPAVEDLWGAGAVLARLLPRLPTGTAVSHEARLALTAYDAVAADLPDALAACASGRELAEAGFGDDVTVAAELDGSGVVPVLGSAGFTGAEGKGPG